MKTVKEVRDAIRSTSLIEEATSAVRRTNAAIDSSSTGYWVHVAVEIPKSSQEALVAQRIPTRLEEQRVALTAEIVSFCPVPLNDWQASAQLALQRAQREWVERLDVLRDQINRTPPAMWQVPFLRLLLEKEGPSDWARLGHVPVDTVKVYGAAHGDLSEFACLRRPFLSWPSVGAGLHVTTTGEGRRLEFRRPQLGSDAFASRPA